MGCHEKDPFKAQTFVQESQLFQLEASSIKKVNFEFLAGVGVSLQTFMLGPCAIAKLQSSSPSPS